MQCNSRVQTAVAEMARLLGLFEAWECSMRAHFQSHGFWSDSVNPRTAQALHGEMGAKYSEAIGAQILLGYTVNNNHLCSVIRHPRHGVHTYPVTFFTTAPLVHVHAALAASCAMDTAELHAHTTTAATAPDYKAPLLMVRDVSVAEIDCAMAPPPVRCAAEKVSLQVMRGQRVVIRGPPGVGKSTFMHALRGMMPLSHGWVAWGARVRAMYVPQNSMLSPSPSLRAQLMYPEPGLCDIRTSSEVLYAVGLGHLWERCCQSMRELHAEDWQESDSLTDGGGAGALTLSNGELQCLAVARVLRVRPDVVLLDEAFSSVPADMEAALLRVLAGAEVTVVMVSHREESTQGASLVLTFNAALPNGWSVDHAH
jgi:ABC-type nitrate/sulfonate/bicarbonate transport system ATPase subunit